MTNVHHSKLLQPLTIAAVFAGSHDNDRRTRGHPRERACDARLFRTLCIRTSLREWRSIRQFDAGRLRTIRRRPRANGIHRSTVPRHSQHRRRQTTHTLRQTLARYDRHRNGQQNRPCGRDHSSNGHRPTRQLRLGRRRHRRSRRNPHPRNAGRLTAAPTATTAPPPTSPDDITPIVATGRAGRVSTRPAHRGSWTTSSTMRRSTSRPETPKYLLVGAVLSRTHQQGCWKAEECADGHVGSIGLPE